MFKMICAIILSALASVVALASTEYVLVNQDADVLAWDKTLTIGRPASDFVATVANGNCGKFYNSSTFAYEVDTSYSGTLFGVYAMSVDPTGAKGGRIFAQTYVPGEDIGPAKHLTNWTEVPKSAGTTCTETVGGISYSFKKYSVTCDTCTP